MSYYATDEKNSRTWYKSPQEEHVRYLASIIGIEEFPDANHGLYMLRMYSGGSSTYHIHEKESETFYALKGKAHAIVDGISYPMSHGCSLYIKPGERHQIVSDCEGDDVYEMLCIMAPIEQTTPILHGWVPAPEQR